MPTPMDPDARRAAEKPGFAGHAFALLKRTVSAWVDDDAPSLGVPRCSAAGAAGARRQPGARLRPRDGVVCGDYKIMPRMRIDWADVWVGALVTAPLFSIGRVLIGLYIGRSAIASGFGAAGSLVVVLVWVYYSAQIFLLGAEFTWVYAHTHGSRRGEALADARSGPAHEA